MSEANKTLTLAGAAVLLAVLAVATSPRRPEAAVLGDQGKPFYPDFTNALKATSLEVSEYDEKKAYTKVFKVAMQGGRWCIPSHFDYPADAEKKLGKAASSLMDLRKETLRSDRPQDHEALGVLDPLDPNVGAAGRGRRVVLKDTGGVVLADYIFGKETKEGSGVRYVRVPDQKKTYTAHVKLEVSTKFEDWIETDLLKMTQPSVRRMTIDNYQVDLDQGRIKDRATFFLSREDAAGAWKVSGMKETEEPNAETIGGMVAAIGELKIIGVRPKPPVLVKQLKDAGDFRLKSLKLTAEQVASLKALQARGYYMVPLSQDEIQMVSNDGELQVSCEDGTVYTLRFGDVVVGEGDALTAGGDEKGPEKKDEKKTGTEGRYLFVTVRYDESVLAPLPPEPVAPPGYKPDEKKDDKAEKKDDPPEVAKYKKDKEEWDRKKTEREKKAADGKKRADELTARFADWYYVISGETFKKLRKDLKDLVKPKEAKKDEKKPDDGHKHDEEKKPEPPKKPEDPKKPDEPKKPEDKKPDEPKKPEEKKADDKKPEEPKKDEPKKEEPKKDEKKP